MKKDGSAWLCHGRVKKIYNNKKKKKKKNVKNALYHMGWL